MVTENIKNTSADGGDRAACPQVGESAPGRAGLPEQWSEMRTAARFAEKTARSAEAAKHLPLCAQ